MCSATYRSSVIQIEQKYSVMEQIGNTQSNRLTCRLKPFSPKELLAITLANNGICITSRERETVGGFGDMEETVLFVYGRCGNDSLVDVEVFVLSFDLGKRFFQFTSALPQRADAALDFALPTINRRSDSVKTLKTGEEQ